MSYLVTARKWRPMVFEDVVGQSHVTVTLRNAIASNRLSHAYVFSGPRGVGKTTTARILAKAINCLHPKEYNPDNACDLCTEITEGRSVNVFEIDGASNRGVDDVRSLREAVRYGPAKGKYKVYIIDEVHMLTKEAFNALLKTLEEPPPYILFIFATTEVHKVPLTILSRCQRFDFRRITVDEIVDKLRLIAIEEKINVDDDTLFIIAKKADGSMRDAQSVFDQLVSFCGKDITSRQTLEVLNVVDQDLFFQVSELIIAKNTKEMLTLVERVIAHGYDLREFLVGLSEHLRNLLVVRSTASVDLVEASEPDKKRYLADAKKFSENHLLRLITVTTQAIAGLRWNQQPRYAFEVALLQMMKMEGSVEIQQLLTQLEELKKKVNAEASSAVAPPAKKEELVETPVRGTVKATPPILRADQIVSPRPAIFPDVSRMRPRPAITEQASLRPGLAETLTLSIDEARSKWSALIDQTKQERIDLWASLGESRPLGVKGDSLQIACPDDYHLDTFKRNREYLSHLAQRVYGSKVKLEAILASSAAADQSAPRTNASPKRDESLDHPVIQALIREFGAEIID